MFSWRLTIFLHIIKDSLICNQDIGNSNLELSFCLCLNKAPIEDFQEFIDFLWSKHSADINRLFVVVQKLSHAQFFQLEFPGVCPNSCPLDQWCHPIISSSVAIFSLCLLSFPASGYFPVSQLLVSGGQNITEVEYNKV